MFYFLKDLMFHAILVLALSGYQIPMQYEFNYTTFESFSHQQILLIYMGSQNTYVHIFKSCV